VATGKLQPNTDYYWRVDENAQDGLAEGRHRGSEQNRFGKSPARVNFEIRYFLDRHSKFKFINPLFKDTLTQDLAPCATFVGKSHKRSNSTSKLNPRKF